MQYWEQLLHEVQNKERGYRYTLNPAYDSLETKVKRQIYLRKYFLDRERGLYLTHREAGCLYYIYKGHTIRSTARELSLSPRTVEFYLQRVKYKFNCRSRDELMLFLQEHDFMVKVAGANFRL